MVSGISGIEYNIRKANRTDGKVQNLAAHIDKEMLRAIHRKMKPGKASGIDEVTKEMYEANLDTNLDNLLDRMKRGLYRPNPSRRAYIPKGGSDKMRPLGISCYEDKLVENAIAQILIPIYEQKFIATSYGFRLNRSCHMAVREVIEMVQYRKTNYVVEADIRSFFDNVDHEWLMKMLAHDIADKRFLEVIYRFLKAGVMENGKYLDSEKGTPQGNGASPVLANVYLHYVLDLWFEKIVKCRMRGQCYLIRYADDFICCFQCKDEAEMFLRALRKRFAKYGLELAEEKTKILEFGRFAAVNRKNRGEEKPETFDFLGFTFYCGKANKAGFFRCRVKTSRKKFISKVRAMKEWIKTNRTMPLKEIFKTLSAKLRGHYQYYGVTDNTEAKGFLKGVKDHRYITLGHDPMLGWVFGTANILTNTLTRSDLQSAHVKYVPGPGGGNKIYSLADTSRVFLACKERLLNEGLDGKIAVGFAVIREGIHLKSDVLTKDSLPIPGISSTVSPQFAEYLCSHGIDTASVGTEMSLSIIINTLIAMVHRFFYDQTVDDPKLYEVRTRKILLYSNLIATTSNVIAVAVTENLDLLDVDGLLVTITRLFSDIRFITRVKQEFIESQLDIHFKGITDEIEDMNKCLLQGGI